MGRFAEKFAEARAAGREALKAAKEDYKDRERKVLEAGRGMSIFKSAMEYKELDRLRPTLFNTYVPAFLGALSQVKEGGKADRVLRFIENVINYTGTPSAESLRRRKTSQMKRRRV